MAPPRSVNLSRLSGTVEIEPGYHVVLPADDCLILVAGAKYPAAATRYDHPHLAARQDQVFHMRFFVAVIWPAICVSGVWFVLTGSFLPAIVLAFAALSAGLACLPGSTGR